MPYYFVAYQNVPKDGTDPALSNVILKDIHPVAWAARPVQKYSEHFITRLLFFTEIPADIAKGSEVEKWCGTEL